MREIYILLAVVATPFLYSHPITNAFETVATKVVQVLGRESSQVGEALARASATEEIQARNVLQKSLSKSKILKVGTTRPSYPKSISESTLLEPTTEVVRNPNFLNWVCRKGKLPMAKVLIDHLGAHPNVDTLNMAAFSGNTNLVKYLIEEHGIEPEIRTLVAAAHSDSLDLLKYLVNDNFLIPEKTVLDAAALGSDENYRFLKSAQLSYAFEESSMNQFQNVLGEIAESYMDYKRSKWNMKLLEEAIDNDDIEQVRELMQEVDLDFSILDRAAKLDDDRIFNILMESAQ